MYLCVHVPAVHWVAAMGTEVAAHTSTLITGSIASMGRQPGPSRASLPCIYGQRWAARWRWRGGVAPVKRHVGWFNGVPGSPGVPGCWCHPLPHSCAGGGSSVTSPTDVSRLSLRRRPPPVSTTCRPATCPPDGRRLLAIQHAARDTDTYIDTRRRPDSHGTGLQDPTG